MYISTFITTLFIKLRLIVLISKFCLYYNLRFTANKIVPLSLENSFPVQQSKIHYIKAFIKAYTCHKISEIYIISKFLFSRNWHFVKIIKMHIQTLSKYFFSHWNHQLLFKCVTLAVLRWDIVAIKISINVSYIADFINVLTFFDIEISPFNILAKSCRFTFVARISLFLSGDVITRFDKCYNGTFMDIFIVTIFL